MKRRSARMLILGAGPTGLGAAWRLKELGCEDFLVLDAAGKPGGLAASYTDEKGFTWDSGGHVQFSHYAYYDRLTEKAMGGEWLYHERQAWVWLHERFIPYPFQNNLRYLDDASRERCVAGLERAATSARAKAGHFGEWMGATFGEGITDVFLKPYNDKVWGYPLDRIGTDWMGERVAVPDVERVKRNIAEKKDDVAWGPNNKFKFPKKGGTGAIWHGVAKLLPKDKLHFGHNVVRVDAEKRLAVCEDGSEWGWEKLLSSLPLDVLCRISGLLSVKEAAARLLYSSVHVIGVGLKGEMPESLKRKSWMYFPEKNSPYYRVTVFSNYSPSNAPAGHWSLMAEVCETPFKHVDAAKVADEAVRAMREDGLIPAGTPVVSLWHRRFEHGYPTPFVGRDEVLSAIMAELEKRSIYSRGRFGGWKYEVSNQDHSAMQGVEWAGRMLNGEAEVTYPDPTRANSGEFLK